MIKNHRNEDDYSRLIAFAKTLWLPNTPILVLLCYVITTQTSSNFLPQQ